MGHAETELEPDRGAWLSYTANALTRFDQVSLI